MAPRTLIRLLGGVTRSSRALASNELAVRTSDLTLERQNLRRSFHFRFVGSCGLCVC